MAPMIGYQPTTVFSSVSTVHLVGPIVQWITSLLLVGVFALLIPLNSQRRAVVTWMVAFVAQSIMLTGPALANLALLSAPTVMRPRWFAVLEPLAWPAQFVSLAAIALGALEAAGWRISDRIHYRLLAAAAALGLLVLVSDAATFATRADLVATVVLVFALAQAIFFRARGPRRRGLIFLASAMTLFGGLSTLYALADLMGARRGTAFERFVHTVALSSGYGDAAAFGVLAAAVIVVIVQEAFLDTTRAHDEKVVNIAASETRLNGIIQAAQEAIVTVGHDGRIELVNAAVEAMLGLPRSELLGRMLSEFVVDPAVSLDRVGSAARADTDLLRPTPATQSGRGRRANGLNFPLEFTVGRLGGEGRSGAVIVLHDLTERNSIQAERERFDRRVAESEKMMAIGRVVSGVAHELNNPLAVVLGQSEQLADAAPAGEVQSGLRLIHEHAHRARHIVKDLLTFVRHREEDRELVNMSRLAERTLASQRATAMTHAVSLGSDLPSNLPPVLIDRAAVEQVLVNLIDNALDAAGTDGVVNVSTRAAGTNVEFVVEDSGRGVPDALRARIFEPFFTTKGPGRGTGLGLSVSQGIAEQHGGSLRLENRPASGIGARFILSLPATTGVPEATSVEPVAAPFPRPPARRDGSAGEVMVIDDEAGVRTTLGRMFKRAGWSVREAASGDDGLAWLATVPDAEAPELILCDLKMPGLSGREVYEQLSIRRPFLLSRIIFVTGDVVESVSNGFIAASGREVVEKPFTVAEIAQAVTRTINTTQV
jgi:PAS domain S-box-containing protein